MIVLVSGFANAADESAGNRPDKTPLIFGSLERKIIKQAEKLQDLREKLGETIDELESEYDNKLEELERERQEAPEYGLPLLTDSKEDYETLILDTEEQYEERRGRVQDKYANRLEDERTELKHSLASPPTSGAKQRIRRYKPYSASREQLEIYNAALNLQSAANTLTARLRTDPADYDQAVETYDAMLQLLATVIEMNTGFVARIEQKYRPEAHKLLNRIRRARAKTQAAEDIDKGIRERELEKLDTIAGKMEENIPKLDEMKKWVGKNIDKLEPIMKTVSLLKENATVVRDVAAWVADIEEGFARLEVSIPPLVEYDLVESDFELETPADLEMQTEEQ